jgi:ribosomal protein L11 methylase PrmA
VLAIAAPKLGFGPVVACDVGEASVVATREGAPRQRRRGRGVALRPAARARPVGADGDREPRCGRCCSRSRATSSARPERLIVSGLLRHEADEVAAAFAARGMTETDRREGSEWSALLLEAR